MLGFSDFSVRFTGRGSHRPLPQADEAFSRFKANVTPHALAKRFGARKRHKEDHYDYVPFKRYRTEFGCGFQHAIAVGHPRKVRPHGYKVWLWSGSVRCLEVVRAGVYR